NHSCNPSVFVDVDARQVVAAHDIPAGAQLTFFYPSTEWDMDQPFRCWCANKGGDAAAATATAGEGSLSCQVRGARHLAPADLAHHRFAPHIVRLLRRHRPE
ncbi:hypothetical protein HK405_014379, partial [Cladochytrium tenue]